jgi:hypothetical protein
MPVQTTSGLGQRPQSIRPVIAQCRCIVISMKRVDSVLPNGPASGAGSPGQAASAAPVTTTRYPWVATLIRAGVVVAAAAGIVSAAISVSSPAIADDPFSLFMFNCGRVPTATPQLCKDTWDMVRKNTCRGEVVVYLDRRGVAFGDDRQMYNYAIQIQTGDVPLNVC